jgi:hypothetical protein
MKYLNILVLLVFLSGCSTFQSDSSMTEPVLLKQAPLPSLPQTLTNKDVELVCEFLIGKDGKVNRVKLLNSSGDENWDYLAQSSFVKWEFSPALFNGEPIEILIRRKVKLYYMEPRILRLAEICCKDQKDADSVYSALKAGAKFSEMVNKFSISPSKENDGVVGEVDIRYYTTKIRTSLSSLSEEEYTKPMPYGDHYIIYKRLKGNKSNVELDY